MARFQRGTQNVRLEGIATPTDSDDAANKAYVDAAQAGSRLSESVEGGTGITVTRGGDSDVISITDGGVGETQLADNAVTTNKIATDAVDTAAIIDGNVTNAKLADDAVTSAKIDDGAVVTAALADSDVTNTKLAPNSVDASKLTDDLTTANLGLSQDDAGRFRLSPAFVEAASVLALSTQYNTPSSVNQAITRLVTNVDGTCILSGSVQADSNTNPSITAFNDEWTSVRSIVLATNDASDPSRSIASLAQFFGPGSILEVHRTDSDYGVWAIDSFSATYTAGNVTYVNINQTAWTDTGQTDRYGNPVYSGLLMSSGNPGAQFGNDYTIRLHGRDSIRDGRLIGDGTVIASKLQATNTGTTGQVPSMAADGRFTWTDTSGGDDIDLDSLIDVWHGFDSEYTFHTGSTPTTAGEVRIGRRTFGTFVDQTDAGAIFEVQVFPYAGNHASLLQEMVVGSPVRVKQSDSDYWIGELTALPRDSDGATILVVGTEGQEDEMGTFNTSAPVTFNFRPSDESPVTSNDIINNAVRSASIQGNNVGPGHLRAGATNRGKPGFVPVSAGSDKSDEFTWQEFHQTYHLPAAEGINDPAVHNVFRVPASGVQSMQKGTIAFTTLNTSSAWGFIDRQSGANTIMIDTPPATWDDIATGANYNSFILANGSSGFNSSVTALLDTHNPLTCGLVWFINTDSDWAIYQWPASSLNQSNGGAVYTNERNLKLVASEGSPDSDMQVGLNIGISPVKVDSDFIRIITDEEWYLSAAGRYIDGYDKFDRAGEARQVRQALDDLETRFDDGIGGIPVTEDSDLRGPNEFLVFTKTDSEISFLTRPADSEGWSALATFVEGLYPIPGLATLHIQISYPNADRTAFVDRDFIWESSNDGTNTLATFTELLNHFTLQVSNNTSSVFHENNEVTETDGEGDVIPNSGDVTTTMGYIRHFFAYDSRGNYQSPPAAFSNIGIPNFNYSRRYNTVIPVIRDNDDANTPHINFAGLGTGLTYDSENNVINSAVSSITPDEVTASGTPAAGRILEATDSDAWAWVNPRSSGWVETSTRDSDDKTPTTDGFSYAGTRVTRGVTGGSFSGSFVTFTMNESNIGDLQAGDTITISGVTGVDALNGEHTATAVTASGNPRHITTATPTAGISGTPSFTNAMNTFITRAATGAQWTAVDQIRISDSIGGTTQTPLFERLQSYVDDSEVRIAIYNGSGFEASFTNGDIAGISSVGAIGSRYWVIDFASDAQPHIDQTFTRDVSIDYNFTTQRRVPTLVQDIAASDYLAGNTTRFLRVDGTWAVPPNTGGGGTGVTVSTETSDRHPSTTELRFPGGAIVGITGVDGGEEIHPRNMQAWLSTATYYAGELVVDSDTIYYASSLDSQSVPAGTALTDTAYWQPVGTFRRFGQGTDGIVAGPNSTQHSPDYFMTGEGAWASSPSTTGKGLVPRLNGYDDSELIEYYLAGDGEWRRVTHDDYRVFTDSETGLVPAPGQSSGLRFLADDGYWRNTHEFYDSEELAHALDFDVIYDAANRQLRFEADERIPGTPGTDGQQAWVVLTFSNSSINSSGTQPLESSAVLTLRAPTAEEGVYTSFNVHWSSADIPQGHGSEGQNDVAVIWANAIGRQYGHLVTVSDIGEADNALTYQMINQGPMSLVNDSETGVIEEFDSHFYTVAATYAQPGSDRGTQYTDGENAVGSYHTNGRPDSDALKVFDTVTLPLQRGEEAGLVPGYSGAEASDHRYVLRPGTSSADAVWTSRNAIETVEAFDVVERVDALSKPRTGAENGLQWGADGRLSRVIKQVQQATEFQSWTLSLNFTGTLLTSVEYYEGNYGPTDDLPGDMLRATKTLNYDSQNRLIGTSIT